MYNNPYLTNPYMQQAMQVQPLLQQQQPMQQQQMTKVDGPNEAMNRFLMQYPASVLVPGFISDPMFDVNGRPFHTLSIEPDGRRNLETFDFTKHVSEQPTQTDYVSRAEFQAIVDKVNQLIGANNGIHEPVQAAATTAEQPV